MAGELIDVVQQIVSRTMKASGLADLVIGTVTKTKPLEVTEQNVRDPIPAAALLLTAAVVEKKIPLLAHRHDVAHTHSVQDTYTGGGTCGQGGSCGDALESVACLEHGQVLPVRDGYLLLNRGLETGDKLLLLRVLGGQSYLVLSRIFKEG